MTKDQFIEYYRDINVDHDWWDFTYDGFKQRMDDVGFTVDEIRFSGFCSQGDGASFNGYVSDYEKFFVAADLPQAKLLALYTETLTNTISVEFSHSYRYVHENTMILGGDRMPDMPGDTYFDDEDFEDAFEHLGSVRVAALGAALRPLSTTKLEEYILDYLRAQARDLYRDLEKEYDHLTSDEAVWETIEANELHTEHLEDQQEAA